MAIPQANSTRFPGSKRWRPQSAGQTKNSFRQSQTILGDLKHHREKIGSSPSPASKTRSRSRSRPSRRRPTSSKTCDGKSRLRKFPPDSKFAACSEGEIDKTVAAQDLALVPGPLVGVIKSSRTIRSPQEERALRVSFRYVVPPPVWRGKCPSHLLRQMAGVRTRNRACKNGISSRVPSGATPGS
jgi:hypothetical protein